MECTCRQCNGSEPERETIEQVIEQAQQESNSVYDRLTALLDSWHLTATQKKALMEIIEEVDEIDGQVIEIQKKLAGRGYGAEARELGSVSQRLF